MRLCDYMQVFCAGWPPDLAVSAVALLVFWQSHPALFFGYYAPFIMGACSPSPKNILKLQLNCVLEEHPPALEFPCPLSH